MPRRPRQHVPGGIYHVILRGNHQEQLFQVDGDYRYLNRIVGEVAKQFDLTILAYCWMTNHLHLAIQVSDTPLAKPMQRLAMRYSRRIHHRAGVVGHLFERRYRALLVDTDKYLLALVRYIHLNPVAAGMVDRPERHPWSSHNDYVGRPTADWIQPRLVMSMLGNTTLDARRSYLRLLGEVDDDADRLVASHELRHPRTDGPGQTELAGRPSPESRLALVDLLRDRSAILGFSPAELASTSRRRDLCRARAQFAREVLALGAGTLTEIAKLLGRSTSALAQSLGQADRRRPDSKT